MIRKFTSSARKVLYVYKKNDIATPVAATVFSGAFYTYMIISEQQKDTLILNDRMKKLSND